MGRGTLGWDFSDGGVGADGVVFGLLLDLLHEGVEGEEGAEGKEADAGEGKSDDKADKKDIIDANFPVLRFSNLTNIFGL